ncbi:MAG: hypothetical protein NC420_14620 [Eubacterium sp.]|nr:hypothetical protein [Eubacterium sp.]MCM1213057.1 hypothetical protein [Lachnospiraceae bacterium]MCM1304704.1 hypothetical protein [Butyrivibrio sp.]MCM1344997.1 hypothetical protein [Muribaculaceae bacterium]MCM1240770.1 hypothetical protein [Lachnospiraceae bacterium]
MMSLDAGNRDLLLQLKKYLRSGGHFREEKEIDQILCQYEAGSIPAKRQYLERLICVCHVKAYGDLYIPDIEWSEWLAFLSRIEEMSGMLLTGLDAEIKGIPLSGI